MNIEGFRHTHAHAPAHATHTDKFTFFLVVSWYKYVQGRLAIESLALIIPAVKKIDEYLHFITFRGAWLQYSSLHLLTRYPYYERDSICLFACLSLRLSSVERQWYSVIARVAMWLFVVAVITLAARLPFVFHPWVSNKPKSKSWADGWRVFTWRWRLSDVYKNSASTRTWSSLVGLLLEVSVACEVSISVKWTIQ